MIIIYKQQFDIEGWFSEHATIEGWFDETLSEDNGGAGSQTLTLPFITDTDTLSVPTITVGAVGITLPLITDSDTLYPPTVALVQSLILPHITDGDSLYAPTISAGATTLSLPFINTSNILNTPTIVLPALEISLPTIVGDVLYPPSIATVNDIILPIINNENNFYIFSVNPVITLPYIVSAETLYAPTIDTSFTTLVLPFLINEQIMNRFLLTKQEKRWTGLTWIE